MVTESKLERTKIWLLQLKEDRADYLLASEIRQPNEPTYTWNEVMLHLGMDKYHLEFRTRRLQKKHKLELDAT